MTDRTHPDSGFPIAYSHYANYAEYVEALHARIAELEAQLDSIGAGGVSGPLMGKPQAMPDLSQLTERGAVAWAGVDAQGLREGSAGMSKEREAVAQAIWALMREHEDRCDMELEDLWKDHPIWSYAEAARASLQSTGFTAADMATAEAQGFRDGVASVAASAGSEPVAWRYVPSKVLGDKVFTDDPARADDARQAGCIVEPLYTHPSPQEGAGWRPIAEAPKDGTLIVLGARNGVWLGKYVPVYQSGFRPENPWSSMLLNHDHMAEQYMRPTHWMPLPKAPAPPASEAKGA